MKHFHICKLSTVRSKYLIKVFLLLFMVSGLLASEFFIPNPTSVYGIYHSACSQSVLRNPAMIGKFDDNSVMLDYNFGGLTTRQNIAVGTKFSINDNFNAGFAMNYLEENMMVGPMDTKPKHYVFSAGVSWDKIIMASLGVNANLSNYEYQSGEEQLFSNYSFGALLEWSILKSLNKGNVRIFNNDLQFDFTPGVSYTYLSLAQEVNMVNWFSYYARVELYNPNNGRRIIGINFSPDMNYGGLQLELFDMISLSHGMMLGSNVSDLELDISQLLSDVLTLFNVEIQYDVFKNLEFKASYGDHSSMIYYDAVFYETLYPLSARMISFKLKWKF